MEQKDIRADNFLIGVGAEKSGTTSLHELLKNNSAFVAPYEKETKFFSGEFKKGPDYQASLYPETNASDAWRIDITPSYFRRPQVYRRIIEYCRGETVIVFLIRNPIHRGFSLYWHDIFHHITWGDSRKIGDLNDFSFHRLVANRHHYYVTPYAKHLKAAREAFGDRLIIGIFEEIIDSPAVLLKEIAARTGARFSSREKMPRTNQIDYAALALDLQSGTLERIQNFYIRHRLDKDDDEAAKLLAAQGTFTHFAPKELCEEWFNAYFRDDCRRCEDLLSKPIESLWKQSDLLSPIYKLPQLAQDRRRHVQQTESAKLK